MSRRTACGAIERRPFSASGVRSPLRCIGKRVLRIGEMPEMTDRATLKSRAGDLRRNLTPAERILWKRLRLRQVCGVRFLRQYVIGSFILDFHAPSLKLAIELDAGQHFEAAATRYDDARSRWLAARGIMVLRYTNLDISQRFDDVLNDITRSVERLQSRLEVESDHPPAAARRPPSDGRG